MQQFDEIDSDLPDLLATVEQIQALADKHKDKPIQLLTILRVIEQLHRDINDELFQPSLPNTRHGLFDLLRDIESHGGWPHIYRMRITELCRNLIQEEMRHGDREQDW